MPSKRCFVIFISAVSMLTTPAWCQTDSTAWKNRFQRFDKDGDGQLTSQELGRPLLFKRLDADANGSVTYAEAVEGFRALANRDSPQGKEFSYGDHKLQKLDVYGSRSVTDDLPQQKSASRPVMIYVHGGGWKKGDKSAVGAKPAFFDQQKWVFVSLNYRLLPDGKHPNNVQDVASAIAWVRNNIDQHGGDPERIFLMGHSAGAHLAALVATDQTYLEKAGESLSALKGVIPLDTNAYDVTKLLGNPTALYREVFGTDAEAAKSASPQFHVAAGKSIPPFLICYSGGLRREKNPQRAESANQFAEILRDAGIAAEVVDGSDRTHGEINQRFGTADDPKVTGKAKKFLTERIEELKGG